MRTLDALSLAACLCVVAGGAMAAGRPPVLARAPQATAKKQHYTVEGSIDVFTYENTLFYWRETMYVLENIPCKYADHASRWFPEYANNSYARVRELASGRVVANISSTIGWGFISAFTDYSNDRVWLFGTHANRCNGNGRVLDLVQSWWSSGPSDTPLTQWETAPAFNCSATHNVQVSRVGPLGAAPWQSPPAAQQRGVLPPHRYVMMLEPFQFAVNNALDGNLSAGWTYVNSTAPKAPSGGPSIRYNPTDEHYYILTGGNTVHLLRTRDFQSWEESSPSPFISPTPADAQVAPYCNFSAEASTGKGSPPRGESFPFKPFVPFWRDNPSAWDENSNDADICCLHPNVSTSYVVWGASTQGRSPKPPLDGTDAGVNVVAKSDLPLDRLLMAYFE